MWWLLTACTQDPSLEEMFAENPSSVYQYLSAVEDPLEKLSHIEQLSQIYPGQTEQLCDLIEESQAKEHCLSRSKRPHLWMKTKTPSNSPKQTQSEAIDCTNQERQQCIQRLASQAAATNDISKALRICNNAKDKWRDECLFVTAEESVRQKGARSYGNATELCLQAGEFSDNCQQHLIMQLAQSAPDADSRSDWESIFSAHNAIQSTWGWRDKETALRYQHRLWAESTGISFSGVNKITGNLLDIIPSDFHPHVYAAAARRLFQLEEANKHSLSEWSNLIQRKLEERSNKPESVNQQRKFLSVPDLWEGTEQNINYLATSRRLTSKTPSIDIQICVLEAAARRPPVVMEILNDGAASSEELVQKTATRLLHHIK